ncbi:MAG: hypothetical protein Hals2KO_16990 [Halioglobus sp.]
MAMPELVGEALLQIDADSGKIAACNVAVARLLGRDETELTGLSWRDVLTGDEATTAIVAQGLAARQYVMLPPFLVTRENDSDVILGGITMPQTSIHAINLLLWPLLDETLGGLQPLPASGDTLAVIGVENLRYSSDTATEQLSMLMDFIASSLAEIVRSADVVSAPLGSAVVVNLRAVDLESARDICRALLSHLHRLLKQEGELASVAHLCAGLAHVSPQRSVLSTLLSANHAFALARTGGAGQQVRIEASGDYQLLVASAINHGGALRAQPIEAEATATPVAAPVKPATSRRIVPQVQPVERDIDGYVVDNMEGAVDQALFLAGLDTPVAIIGPAGTGKMYVAKVMHDTTGAEPGALVQIDCREFRGRKSADAKISSALARSAGQTLVFKSPQLMHADVQQKLARQIRTRVLADSSPPRALERVKFIALFPQSLERLMRKGELTEALAGAFGGYPIYVPPIKDRKQAVLRWAHKILVQEGEQRDRAMRGFTPDAEQAMLLYDWPGNISEMRQCISDALDKTDKTWLTPVDLGLFDGIDPEGSHFVPESAPFLSAPEPDGSVSDAYEPSTLESLDVALGQAVRAVLELELIKPLGTWLEDEMVAAAMERYREDTPRAAEFLHTRSRNISRWMPKISAREAERAASALWQTPRRLVREWVRECSQLEDSPMLMLQDRLLAHLEEQAGSLSAAKRARLLGVSTPTYMKRLKQRADT